MKLAAFLAGCLISAPLCAVEKVGLNITITEEEDNQCDEGGGCYLVPRAAILEALRDAYKEGMNACHGRDRL